METNDLLMVGNVVGEHGLKGTIKVFPYTEEPEDFLDYELVNIKNQDYQIERSWIVKGLICLKLKGVNSRESAEALKGSDLYITRDQARPLEEDEYYISDLIGFRVIDKDSKQTLGELKEIQTTSGSVNNFVIKTETEMINIPARKEFFEIVFEDQTILADIPKEYFEICAYRS